MSKFLLQESDFPLDAWGQVCRDVYLNSRNKNAKFPCYDAIKDTAKLAVCACAIDKTSPSSINLTFPGIVIKEADNTEKSCGSWRASFESEDGTEDGQIKLMESLDEEVEAPASSFSEQWANAWKSAAEDEIDIPVETLSDRALGLWVWGACVVSLEQAKKEGADVNKLLQDASIQWIVRASQEEKTSIIQLLPGCSNFHLKRIA